MRTRWVVGLLLTLPGWGVGQARVEIGGIRFAQQTLSHYRFDPTATAVALGCPYASANFINPTDWDSARLDRRITAVELVYSQHPVDTLAWLTPFGRLMAARLAALQALEPRLLDTAVIRRVRWTLIRQTGARSRAHAEALFHGVVIHYRTEGEQSGSRHAQERELERVRRILSGREPLPDSGVIRYLATRPTDRYQAVVMDWTGSMYPHGAGLLRALQTLQRQDFVGALVLFNDGDDLVHKVAFRLKPPGSAGGIYECEHPRELTDLLETLGEVMQRGDGGEPAENNVEALLWAQRRYPHYGRLFHLADNSSGVRDLALLPQLQMPVDIVACPHPDRPRARPNLDLLTIAWATGGSFWLRDQRLDFASPRAPGPFAWGKLTLVVQGNRLVVAPRERR